MASASHERSLSESDLDADPHRQFRVWLDEAIAAGEPAPTAMALATVGEDGLPALRMMLLEDFDSRGFVIQTNLESPKARALAATPAAALAFYWPLLVRQVRVTGRVEPLTRDEMAGYFARAPAGVQAMLRACHQSQVIADRSELERMFAESLSAAPAGVPDHWGGYRLIVATIEFWQGRANWLQDRLRYTRTAAGWRVERLVP
ncbi:MAG TPA: pyridoxamine 5'-phosphate oxidase [Chloroflexota bacterium]|nr:pyridoxamine 5'-phosphate oxidase [Chloroflexota bacterium]